MDKKKNPWLSLWRYPEKTISRLVSAKNSDHVNLITILLGISIALSSLTYFKLLGFDIKSKYLAIFYALIIGAAGSWLYVNVGAHFLSFIGSRLRGSGKPNQVKLAIVWSSVPLIAAIPFWIPGKILDLFIHDFKTSIFLFSIMFFALIFNRIGGILHVFSFGYLIRMLAVVHHFSKWKSFFTILIGILSVVIPITLVYFIVRLFLVT